MTVSPPRVRQNHPASTPHASIPCGAVDDVPAQARAFGLSDAECDHLLTILGRAPSLTELGIFSVMWSEHCSYKSSRIHLKKLPTTAPWVIQGPGENAGVIDIGDGWAAVFKIESHNHPSFIEPYQGAATGVGGILRDVFTMGARPVAILNALRFGSPDHPRTRTLVSGVVAGIAGYGNCMGIATVGGETNFHPAYNGNILVNAMTVGLARADRIFYARGADVGMPVVYVGSKTGRDGIHGATMASASFDDDAVSQRPTVQVGDPFTEKLLLEACLELMAQNAIVSIQDMGAAGLTSSSVEIAAKGGIGVHLVLDHVPQRETGMQPYEIMLSESQERMLMILKPGSEEQAKAIFKKWDLDFAVIGRTTDTGRLVLEMQGQIYCDLPVAPLVDEAPLYDRPHEPTPPQAAIDPASCKRPVLQALPIVMRAMDMVSKRWIWEQYDSLVGSETLASPGITGTQCGRASDAAIIRLPEQGKALAMTTDCTPRYCQADPVMGGRQAVAESWRNLVASGARPLAWTNNLNFGNPQKPRIMGQIVGCIDGMAEAGRALEYPVISGNVSLYNETNDQGILPTPVIGGVGIIDDLSWVTPLALAPEHTGATLVVIGDTVGHLGQSMYLRECFGREDGPPPPVDLALERANAARVTDWIRQGRVLACHDVSDGGIIAAIVDMLMDSGLGIDLVGDDDHAFWFGEDQARYIVAVRDADGIAGRVLGQVRLGATLSLAGDSVDLAMLRTIHERTLPDFMKG